MQGWASDEVARNGALLRINFGQRFSWAPHCFTSSFRTALGITLPRVAASDHTDFLQQIDSSLS